MNADHTRHKTSRCEVVSMVGFGSVIAFLIKMEMKRLERIHGKDLHWVGDYWLEFKDLTESM